MLKFLFNFQEEFDYIPTPVGQLSEDDSMEVPFLEKQGRWIFPLDWLQISEEEREKRIADDGPPSLFERATYENERPHCISQKANTKMIFPCGKCCCCYKRMNYFQVR